jgi:hypothetical protein
MTLKVGNDGVSNRYTITVFNSGNRDQSLQLIAHVDTPGHRNRRECALVFVDKLGLHMGDKVGARKERLSIISPVEPFFRLEHPNCGRVRERHNIFRFVNDLEGVVIVGESTTI